MKENGKADLAVTGGTGFIARGVLETCVESGLSCRALSRSTRPPWAGQAIEWLTVPSYSDAAALTKALTGVRHILHLADNPDRNDVRSAEDAARICVALIEAVRSNRVKGVIVASSVYAAKDQRGRASYGSVKRMIEREFLSAQDLRTIVLRLPPVYGPGGQGGLATLSRLVRKGLPLPLGAATVPRSYLSRRNLASLVVTIVGAGDDTWRSEANKLFEPSDGIPVSTRDIVRGMAAQIGVRSRLIPIPIGLLRMAAAAAGRSELVSSAIDSLEVAPVEVLEAAFGWRPIERMPESLAFLRDEVRPS